LVLFCSRRYFSYLFFSLFKKLYFQETVRNELSHCTVICIAHRLHTIAYYDSVLVMDKGRVAECAAPYTLLNTPGSLFRQMCVTSGDFDELYATAKQAHRKGLSS
jgi:ABC-type glutathione transport system ATPase component